MNATRPQLKAQYLRAKDRAWTEHFREAANTITQGFFDTADLMGIGSRETNLDPKWITKPGDKGNGFGLMQIDKRSFPEFTSTDKWKDARLGILYGAKVLMQKWNDVQNGAGKRLSVTSSKTGKRSIFTGPVVSGVAAQQVTIAAYNAGRWPMYSYANGNNPDQYTTGKDYSSDVMARARVFRELLGNDGMLDFPSSTAAVQQTAEDSSTKLETLTALHGQSETPPSNNQESSEVTAKRETDTATGTESVEVTKKNEQNVNEVATVEGPKPYNDVGLKATLIGDAKPFLPANGGLQMFSEYAQQATGWPPWVIGLIGKAAIILLVITVAWFLYRIATWVLHNWRENERVKLSAQINSDVTRKNVEFTAPEVK